MSMAIDKRTYCNFGTGWGATTEIHVRCRKKPEFVYEGKYGLYYSCPEHRVYDRHGKPLGTIMEASENG